MAPTNALPAVDWATRYRQVRAATEALCQPLETEDYVIQSAVFVSPTRWHLAHTSWFFETFVLAQGGVGNMYLDRRRHLAHARQGEPWKRT